MGTSCTLCHSSIGRHSNSILCLDTHLSQYDQKDLMERKQTQKFSMYRKLWWAILGSIMVIFGFFFFNSFTFASASDPDFVPFHWKTRWFVLDGWLNLVYLGDVVFIAYMWRPTANNRRFATSDELAQDDEGFEIADFGAEEDDMRIQKTRLRIEVIERSQAKKAQD